MSRRISIAILLSTFFLTNCNSPQTFDECVLQKMDGKAKDLLPNVNNVCELRFPTEKRIYNEDLISLNWYLSTNASPNAIEIYILRNVSDYRITRVVATFSVGNQCIGGDENDFKGAIRRTKTFLFSEDLRPATLPLVKDEEYYGYKYMCDIKYYGIRVR